MLPDTRRHVVVRVRRPGLKAIHAEAYEFRSRERKHESALRAAFLAPELFQTGVARAHLFPLRPLTPKRWQSVLAVSFPVFVEGEEHDADEAVRDFGVVLRKGNQVAHRFNRRITLRPRTASAAAERSVTFLEFVELPPGGYRLTMVMSDPRHSEPHGALLDLELPPVPRRQVTVAEPILGRAAGANVVVTAGPPPTKKERKRGDVAHASERDLVGTSESFEPLLVQQVDRLTELLALTRACLVGRGDPEPGSLLVRSLRRGGEDEPALALPERPVALDGDDPVRCARVLDTLAAGALGSGPWVFEAAYLPGGETPRGEDQDPFAASARFSVISP